MSFKVGDTVFIHGPDEELEDYPVHFVCTEGGMWVAKLEHVVPMEVYNSPLFQALL